MKKILFSALAAIGLLFTPACSDESELLNTGNEELVTFTVSVADGLQTKATISDGKKARWLVYEVYEANDADKQVVHGTAQLQEPADSWTIQLQLVKEKQYNIAFWAQTQDPSTESDYYDVSNLRAVKVKYDSQDTNIEERDAFCHIESNYEVSSTTPRTVKLKRPFAQLNFLANSEQINAANKAGLDFTANPTAAVSVEGVADTYDVLKKKATASTSSVTANFTAVAIPFASAVANDMNGAESHDIEETPYYFIATNYILPCNDGSSGYSNVKATLTVNGGTVSNAKTVVENTPLKPNHRTNIYGNVLTAKGTFNVEIKPEFAEPDNIKPVDTPVTPDPNPSETTASVDTYAKLTAALSNTNITTITLGADITLENNLTIDKNVTIDGGETKYGFKGSADVSVASPANVTFNHVTFKNNTTTALQATNYSGTLKVENCKFTYVAGSPETTDGFTQDGIKVTTNGGKISILNNEFKDAGVAIPNRNSTYVNIKSESNPSKDENATLLFTGNSFAIVKSMSHEGGIIQITNLNAGKISVGNNSFSSSTASDYFGSEKTPSVRDNTGQVPATATVLKTYFGNVTLTTLDTNLP